MPGDPLVGSNGWWLVDIRQRIDHGLTGHPRLILGMVGIWYPVGMFQCRDDQWRGNHLGGWYRPLTGHRLDGNQMTG